MTTQVAIKFPAKIPCTGCFSSFDVASMEELDAVLARHQCYFGRVDPAAPQKHYDDGYAKGFAAGFEAGRAAAAREQR
jgi:hypothetical protein